MRLFAAVGTETQSSAPVAFMFVVCQMIQPLSSSKSSTATAPWQLAW